MDSGSLTGLRLVGDVGGGGGATMVVLFLLLLFGQPAIESANAAARIASTRPMGVTQSAIGRRMKKLVPFPGSLLKSIVPSCNWTIRNVMARPMPDPSFLVVKYSVKIFSRSSGGIPSPESEMRISAESSAANDSNRSSPP